MPAQPIDPGRKVILAGFASSSRDMAPYADTSFEVWSLNHGYQWIPRWTRWFEMHRVEHIRSNIMRAATTYQGTEHWDWLRKVPPPGETNHGPIYMQEAHPEVPASVRWPREDINAWLAAMGEGDPCLFSPDYYTSSISHMLALAMYDGFGWIGLYGIDLLQDEEYYYQRAGAEYLIGLARGRGHRVYIPQQSALCKANYVYGYTEPPFDAGVKLEPLWHYLEDKATLTEANSRKAQRELDTMIGAEQVRKMIAELQAKGEPADEVLRKVIESTAKVPERLAAAQGAIMTLTGQSEAFKSACVWGRHFERGGGLLP